MSQTKLFALAVTLVLAATAGLIAQAPPESLYKKADANDDGKLTALEFSRYVRQLKEGDDPKLAKKVPARTLRFLRRLIDSDRDGEITESEFEKRGDLLAEATKLASRRPTRRRVDLAVPLPPAIDPPTDVKKAISQAVEVLLASQEAYVRDPGVGQIPADRFKEWQDGERKRLEKLRAEGQGAEWPYEGVYRTRQGIPPGYRVGGTAIVCSALVTVDGYGQSEARQKAVSRAIPFMLEQLEDNPLLVPGPKKGYDVRGWGHTYALDFFLLALRKKIVDDPKMVARIKKMIPHLIHCLKVNETSDGGWNYAGGGCSPFMTGSTLIALYQAKADGYEIPKGLVERALAGLERARGKNGALAYAGGRPGTQTLMPGASARSAIAELSLHQAGRSDAKRLRVAVDAFFAHWDELLKRKSQQGTHVGKYGIAPYYFFYGHTYAARAIELLPAADRPALRKKMADTLWKTREADGAWNDRIFPRTKSYSTAMALLALVADRIDPLPTWESAQEGGKEEETEKKESSKG